MEVPSLGVDFAPHRRLAFALPVVHEDHVGRNLVQRLKEVRERLGGRLFERHDPNVGVVEPQMRPVALERGVTEVVVEKCVLAEADRVRLARCVVQEAPKEGERLRIRQHLRTDGVRELHHERLDLVP
jgi:hypothetical protein